MALGLFDGEFAEVKDAGGEYRVDAAFEYAFCQMFERTDAAGGDHGYADGAADGAVQLIVES